MASFLFWNINNHDLARSIAKLAHRHSIDVLMLAENNIDPAKMLIELNSGSQKRAGYHFVIPIGCDKISIFTRFSPRYIPPVFETDRLTIRNLSLPGLRSILLAIVHFPSKLHWSDSSQALECVSLSSMIRETEIRIGHSRSVLVGDLNMNPFEDGVVGASGLHGVMSKSIAQKGSRIIQSQNYPFFYNPMWRLLGDESKGTAGSYFYSSSEQRVYFWNLFDQVMIRPDLIEQFENDNLEILTSDGEESLISPSGIPNSDFSDHLPIFFSLRL